MENGGTPRLRHEGDAAAVLGLPLLGALLDASEDAIVCVDAAGAIVEWSRGAASLFGRTRKDALGMAVADLFEAAARGEVVGIVDPALPRRGRRTLVAVRSDDSRLIAELAWQRLRHEVAGYAAVLVVRDATLAALQHAATAALAADLDPDDALVGVSRVLERIAPVTHVALCAVEGAHYRRVASSGRAADRIVTGELLEFRGSPFQVVAERRRPLVCRDTRLGHVPFDAILADAGVLSYVTVPLLRGGNVFATFNVGFAEPDGVGDYLVRVLVAFCSAAMPVVVALLALEEQSRTLDRLERAGAARGELLNGIVHDIRTPLAVVAASAESLLDRWSDIPDREKVEMIGAVVRNSSRLARLVDEGLEVDLLDSDAVVVARQPFSLAAEVRRTAAVFAAARSGAPVRVAVDPEVPDALGDPAQNWRVLTNLLSNAAKFSPAGAAIDVSVTRVDGSVSVAVTDYGPGIDERELPKLFQKFSRLSGNNGQNGAGLGLYISKQLVERQGGRIDVASEVGRGSTFTYTLPAAS